MASPTENLIRPDSPASSRDRSALAIASVTSTRDGGGLAEAYPDGGSFTSDLRAGLEAVRSLYLQSDARVFADVYGAMASDPAARALFHDHYLRPRHQSLGRAIERGIDRGELRADTDAEIVGDIVSGPFLYRLLAGAEGFRDELVDAIVASVLALYGVRRGPGQPAAAGTGGVV